jgi:hypothetical protein
VGRAKNEISQWDIDREKIKILAQKKAREELEKEVKGG